MTCVRVLNGEGLEVARADGQAEKMWAPPNPSYDLQLILAQVMLCAAAYHSFRDPIIEARKHGWRLQLTNEPPPMPEGFTEFAFPEGD